MSEAKSIAYGVSSEIKQRNQTVNAITDRARKAYRHGDSSRVNMVGKDSLSAQALAQSEANDYVRRLITAAMAVAKGDKNKAAELIHRWSTERMHSDWSSLEEGFITPNIEGVPLLDSNGNPYKINIPTTEDVRGILDRVGERFEDAFTEEINASVSGQHWSLSAMTTLAHYMNPTISHGYDADFEFSLVEPKKLNPEDMKMSKALQLVSGIRSAGNRQSDTKESSLRMFVLWNRPPYRSHVSMERNSSQLQGDL